MPTQNQKAKVLERRMSNVFNSSDAMAYSESTIKGARAEVGAKVLRC